MNNKSIFSVVKNECERCGRISKTHSHHLSYKENITIELCPACHRKAHSKGDLYNPIDKRKDYKKLLTREDKFNLWRQFLRFEVLYNNNPKDPIPEPVKFVRPKLSIWSK